MKLLRQSTLLVVFALAVNAKQVKQSEKSLLVSKLSQLLNEQRLEKAASTTTTTQVQTMNEQVGHELAPEDADKLAVALADKPSSSLKKIGLTAGIGALSVAVFAVLRYRSRNANLAQARAVTAAMVGGIPRWLQTNQETQADPMIYPVGGAVTPASPFYTAVRSVMDFNRPLMQDVFDALKAQRQFDALTAPVGQVNTVDTPPVSPLNSGARTVQELIDAFTNTLPGQKLGDALRAKVDQLKDQGSN